MANDVVLGVSVDTKKARSSLSSFADFSLKSFNSIALGITGLNQGLGLVSKGFSFVGDALASTVKPALEFSASLQEIQTLLSDGEVSSKQLGKTILGLQKSFGGSQKTIAKAYYDAISSGAVKAADAGKFLADANKLAVGGVTDVSTAVDGLTTVISAFGLNTDRTQEITDSLFIAMKNGKTTVGELSGSLGVAASQAGSLGVDFKELLAASSALTTGGISTNVAFTQVRAALTSLSKPTKDLQGLYDELGITSIKAQIEQDGLVGTLKKLVGQTNGSAEALGTLFGSVEAIGAVTALTSKSIGNTFTNTLNDMGEAAKDSGKVSSEAFGKISKDASFQFKQLQGTIDATMTQIGLTITENLGPTLAIAKNVVQDFGDAITLGLRAASKEFGKSKLFSGKGLTDTINAGIKIAIKGFGLLTKAIFKTSESVLNFAVYLTEIGAVSAVITGLEKAFVLADTAVNRLTKTVADLAGFKAFLTGDIEQMLEYRKVVSEADKELEQLAQKFDSIKPIDFTESKKELELMRDAVGEVGDVTEIVFDTAIENYGKRVGTAAKAAKEEIQKELMGPGRELFDQAQEAKKAREQEQTAFFDNLLGNSIAAGTAFLEAAKKGGIEGAKNLAVSSAKGISDLLGASDPFTALITSAIDLLATDGAPQLIRSLIENIPQLIETMVYNLPVIATALVELLGDPKFYLRVANALYTGFTSGITDAANNARDGFKVSFDQGWTDVRNKVSGFAVDFRNSLKEGIDNFVSDFKAAWAGVRDTILAPFKAIAGLYDDIQNALDRLIQNLTGGKSSVGGRVKATGKNIGESIGKVFEFSEGGIVPNGFNNDTFPARLTSGEAVIKRDTTEELASFLARQGNVEALLAKIAQAVSQPMQIQTAVEVDGNAFADIQLELSRRGARTA